MKEEADSKVAPGPRDDVEGNAKDGSIIIILATDVSHLVHQPKVNHPDRCRHLSIPFN